ncbi:MAG: TolC family protein, partial [Gammaproteobacteria bacterium]
MKLLGFPLRYLSWLVAGLMAGTLAGCAAYHARALPAQPDTHSRLPAPQIKVTTLHLPGLIAHPFDARHGLDMTDVAILAVLNDPGLKTLRAREAATSAQAFAAGLLPGPQLSYSRDRPTGDTTGLVDGRSVGLAYDLNTLVASHFDKSAARASAHEADLDVLWAEWQTAQQARMLFVQITHDTRELGLLKQLHQVMDDRDQNLKNALKEGDVAYDTLGLELAAMQDVDARVDAIERDNNESRFALNQLLGLAPEVQLDLTDGTEDDVYPSDAQIGAALGILPQRRPDLIGLQYAYQSADEAVRRAVVAQFPAINLGINRASDTSGIHTAGLSIGITFPFIAGGPASVHAAEAGRDAVWQ